MSINIPNFLDMQIVNEQGYLTDDAKQMFNQLFSQLQTNLSAEGIFLPQQDATNITVLDNIKSNSAIIYNTTTNKAMVNENGSFKTIQTL
jgi:hypothetical protein